MFIFFYFYFFVLFFSSRVTVQCLAPVNITGLGRCRLMFLGAAFCTLPVRLFLALLWIGCPIGNEVATDPLIDNRASAA